MGLMGKIKSKADWVAAIVAAYAETGDFGSMLSYYSNLKGVADEVKATLTWKGLLMAKLGLNGDTAYGQNLGGTIAKYSGIVWLASDFGLISPKYKKLAEKTLKGGLFAAITLPAPSGAAGGSTSAGTSGMIY